MSASTKIVTSIKSESWRFRGGNYENSSLQLLKALNTGSKNNISRDYRTVALIKKYLDKIYTIVQTPISIQDFDAYNIWR
jgi:hypothetical protein